MAGLMPFRRGNRDRDLVTEMWDSFNDFFSDNFFAPARSDIHQFRTDIRDTGSSYVIEADLPGFKKEDIKVDYDNNYLTIEAFRENESKEEKENYLRQERNYGHFIRRFFVEDLNVSKIDAAFKDGVLTLNCPKLIIEKTDRMKIEIH